MKRRCLEATSFRCEPENLRLFGKAKAKVLSRAVVPALLSLGALLLPVAASAQGASQQQAAWQATHNGVFNDAAAQLMLLPLADKRACIGGGNQVCLF